LCSPGSAWVLCLSGIRSAHLHCEVPARHSCPNTYFTYSALCYLPPAPEEHVWLQLESNEGRLQVLGRCSCLPAASLDTLRVRVIPELQTEANLSPQVPQHKLRCIHVLAR
jgi:hypothetical protein